MEADTPKLHPVVRLSPHELSHNHHAADPLGDHCGDGCPRNSHMEAADKEKIQDHIHHAGHSQINQRMGGISHSPEHAGSHIVEQRKGNSCKINHQVQGGIGKHVLRNTDGLKKRPGKGKAQRSENHAEQGSESHGGVNCPAHLMSLLRSKILRNHNPGACGEPHKKSHQHVDNRCGGSHCRQGTGTHIIPHHVGVHRIVELLKEISDQQRHRKPENRSEDSSSDHICIHI